LHLEIASSNLPMASSNCIFMTGRATRPIGAKAEAPTMEATIAINLNIFLVLNCGIAATTRYRDEENKTTNKIYQISISNNEKKNVLPFWEVHGFWD
jgi:hypothetical protein